MNNRNTPSNQAMLEEIDKTSESDNEDFFANVLALSHASKHGAQPSFDIEEVESVAENFLQAKADQFGTTNMLIKFGNRLQPPTIKNLDGQVMLAPSINENSKPGLKS